MENNHNQKLKEFQDKINLIDNEKLLMEEKNIFNKNFLGPLYQQLKDIPNEKKKEFGKTLNFLKNEIENITIQRIENLKVEKISKIKPDFDPIIFVDSFKSGILNPLNIVRNQILNFFKKASFDILNENELTTEEYNFDRLNIKKDHPARSASDAFFMGNGKMLRAHCTAVTAKALEINKNCKEIKVVSYGNVYRKDDDDSTHSHQFNQVDMVWVKKNLSVANLKWLMDSLLKYLFGDDIKTRYRISYFPFTEPSFEIDISCFSCKNKGCSICKKTGWIEILGAGMLHPNVLNDANIKDSNMNGIACGIGIDRITMIKFGITDIRNLYNNNFEFMKEFRGRK